MMLLEAATVVMVEMVSDVTIGITEERVNGTGSGG